MDLQKIVVLCAVVVVVGGGVWFVSQKPATAPATSEEANSAPTADVVAESDFESITGLGSLATLMTLGQTFTCEYRFSDNEGNAGSGTGYFDGERLRVDSSMTTDGERFNSSMINDGTFIYTWTTGGTEQFAMKMRVPEDTGEPMDYTGPEEDSRSHVDMDQEVEYDCDRWRVDPSVFVPPTNVDFMDMEAMMNEMMQGMPEGFELPEGVELPAGFQMP